MKKGWISCVLIGNRIELYKTEALAQEAFSNYWPLLENVRIGALPIRSGLNKSLKKAKG
jgi:hypothetical protein